MSRDDKYWPGVGDKIQNMELFFFSPPFSQVIVFVTAAEGMSFPQQWNNLQTSAGFSIFSPNDHRHHFSSSLHGSDSLSFTLSAGGELRVCRVYI